MAFFPAWMAEAFRAGGGKISVEEFMRLALYDLEHGYYSTNVKTVGRGGDFSTTATMHPALGEAIAGWLGERDVIEIGGGDGSLAEGVLKSMGWWRRRRVRYHLVETSAPLMAAQQKRLGKRVIWHRTVEQALEACGGMADIFSNELVDAFPAVALRYDGVGDFWEEVFVRQDGSEEFVRSKFVCDLEGRPGQRIERHCSYRDWLKDWMPLWTRGRMLTIDYGWEWPQLGRRSLAGSLRAYFAQLRLDEPGEFYQRAGKQDLTADVNFSELMDWGAGLGLEMLGLETQREFLLQELPDLEKRAEKDAALAFLIDEAGAGSAFSVLEQRRGPTK